MPRALSRAKAAAIYPFRLCKAILEGFSTQLMIDQKLVRRIHGLHCDVETDLVLQDQCQEWMNDKATNELNVMQQTERYVDAVTGQPLIPALVRAARSEELRYFETKGVWHRRPRVEALMRTGKSPISVKWVDTNMTAQRTLSCLTKTQAEPEANAHY